MRIRMDLIGTTQLVMHNVQLSDPANEFTIKIGELTSKKDKTAQDFREIADLEWLGGLYIGRSVSGIVVPAANVHKTLNRGAVLRREGKNVERAVIFTQQEFPLIIGDPKDPIPHDLAKLQANPAYRFQTAVRVGQNRVQRMRPCFPVWALSTEWELETDVMDLSTLRLIAKDAGRMEGLGDHRTKGSGRFNVSITEVKEKDV